MRPSRWVQVAAFKPASGWGDFAMVTDPMLRTLLATALLCASALTAHAQPLTLGEAAYGGTGCPQGTARVVVGADRTTLSLLFDQYEAAAGGVTGRGFDRKSCNLAIPLNVPAGYSVSIFAIDYRGFNHLPAGGRSVFTVEYFFAGGAGPRFERTFAGPLSQSFFLSDTIAAATWSACGADVILRTNSSVRVTTPSGQQAVATVDTADISAAIVFRLAWRRC